MQSPALTVPQGAEGDPWRIGYELLTGLAGAVPGDHLKNGTCFVALRSQ